MKNSRPIYAFLITLLALLGSLLPMFAEASADVTGMQLVSSVRSGRTTMDYSYRITVNNGSPALQAAEASVVSNSASAQVLKGTLSLGNLAVNSTSTSADTFTIRIDRSIPFNPAWLVWTVTGTSVVPVPNVVGLTQAAASTAITGAGLAVGTVTTQNSSTVPSGSVISQNPAAGTSVALGSAVALVVSSGPAPVSAPNVVGLTQAAASTAITGAGLAVGTVTQQNSSTVPSGSVISQNPTAGTSVAPGSAVALVVSSGPAPVSVPNVVGLTQAAASTAITGAGLAVGTVTQQNSSTVPSGSVISQNPTAGASVAPGSTVALVVSSGPATVTVPGLGGLNQAGATNAITGAGLVVGTVTQQISSTVPAGFVISQSPTMGTNVAPGSAVSFVISLGSATVPGLGGLNQAGATNAITAAGLVVGTVTTQINATVPAGFVISQNPAMGTVVVPGSAVSFVVSLGSATVPGLGGLNQAGATSAIMAAGLVVGTVTTQNSTTIPAGFVVSQNPAQGTVVAPGTAVSFVVSLGPVMVSVPNVVGLTQTAAQTAITGAGLVVGLTTVQNSAVVPSGSVIIQSPAAGTSVATGSAIDITVSVGPATGPTPAALNLTLSQLVVGAGDPLTVASDVLDSGGNSIASPPAIDFSITAAPGGSTGTPPTVSGSQIVTGTDTRGSYQLTGTVHGTTVTTTIGFTVLQNGTQSDNAAQLTAHSLVQAQVTQNLKAIAAAFQSGNTAAIPALNTALSAATSTLALGKLGFATGYEPDTGFIPPASQLASSYPPTAADGNFTTLVANLRAKIQQITTLLNTPTGSDAADTAALQTYMADLTALVAQVKLAANTPTPYGLSNNVMSVDGLLNKDMPALMKAIASRVGTQLQTLGLAANSATPTGLYQLAQYQFPSAMYANQQQTFLLTGLLGSCGVIGELVQKIYGPFLDQLQKMAILLAAQHLLNAYVNNFPVVGGMVTGASQSFQAYHMAGSIIYLGGVTNAQANSAEVYLIGGAAINAIETAANALGGIKNVKDWNTLYKFYKELDSAVQGLGAAGKQAHQQPNSIYYTSFDSAGCLLSSVDPCYELNYDSGFSYVGSGGPISLEPVIVLVRIPDPTTPGYGSQIFNFAGK